MPLLPVVLVATLVLGLWAAVEALRGRPPSRPLLQSLLALQVVIVVQVVLGLLELADGVDRAGLFAGYLLMDVLLLPGAFALTVEERTRYGTLVLAVACFVLALVQERLQAAL